MSRSKTARTPLVIILVVAIGHFSVIDRALHADDAEQSIDFDRQIAPLLAQRCLACHNTSEKKGGLILERKSATFNGGESGKVIVSRKPDDSLLWQRVRDDEMPPKNPLPPTEKDLIRKWIASGAAWGTDPIDMFRITTDRRAGYDWWSLQPIKDSALPIVQRSHWPQNGIDNFVLTKLESKQISPSIEAGRRTLIRRLYFDLLGLPPSPDQVKRFTADPSDGSYERLVDQLIASPNYGVRWGRHWLDIARFGESQGFERDKLRPNSWPYRDWVIDALNRDMRYDEFARQQLAGDVVYPGQAEPTIATGFLVAGAYDEVGQSQQSATMRAIVRQDELEDYVSVVGQTFLGMTINCARCHDHKFDPVRQKEYYQLTSALSGVRHGEREIKNGRKHQTTNPGNVKPQKTYAVTPRKAEVTHLLHRGSAADRREAVSPGGVASLVGVNADFQLAPDASDSDRRRALSNWIANAKNPLFARVIVNRLWHYHFGVGLVDSPSDFGFNGGRPTHPELIDFLAAELIRSKWSLKHVQRLIVTSATYRQSSRHRDEAFQVDAGNRLLWRKSPMRLDAEVLRDTTLRIAGELNEQMGGPGYQDFDTFTRNTQFYVMKDVDGPAYNRRSVYRMWIRSGRSPFLDVFDCPDPSTKTPKRAVTTTPLQALTLMNNSFVLRMSERFAKRAAIESAEDPIVRIGRAYEFIYNRQPSEDELVGTTRFVEDHGLSAFCRVLLNSNEFLYID